MRIKKIGLFPDYYAWMLHLDTGHSSFFILLVRYRNSLGP
jgi:hypothetical protein